MSLDQLMTKVPPKKKRGFVAEKIATYKSKKRRNLARGGAHNDEAKSTAVVKIHPVMSRLLAAMTDDDIDRVAQVYREAMQAETWIWIDEGKDEETGRAKGHRQFLPDHKIRLQAANMVAAYKEGLPVQRQIRLDANFTELRDEVEAFKRSPAMQDFARRLASGEIQIPGGEKQVENAREIPPTNYCSTIDRFLKVHDDAGWLGFVRGW
jgi:hypothetical protein